MKHEGAKMMFVLRCSMIIPCQMLNYAAAVTEITFWQFTVGNNANFLTSLVWIYTGTSAASIKLSWQ